MVRELDAVALKLDTHGDGPRRGDVGAVVHCYAGTAALEVEFSTAGGKMIALLALTPADVRPMRHSEILHVREVAQAAV